MECACCPRQKYKRHDLTGAVYKKLCRLSHCFGASRADVCGTLIISIT